MVQTEPAGLRLPRAYAAPAPARRRRNTHPPTPPVHPPTVQSITLEAALELAAYTAWARGACVCWGELESSLDLQLVAAGRRLHACAGEVGR